MTVTTYDVVISRNNEIEIEINRYNYAIIIIHVCCLWSS